MSDAQVCAAREQCKISAACVQCVCPPPPEVECPMQCRAMGEQMSNKERRRACCMCAAAAAATWEGVQEGGGGGEMPPCRQAGKVVCHCQASFICPLLHCLLGMSLSATVTVTLRAVKNVCRSEKNVLAEKA